MYTYIPENNISLCYSLSLSLSLSGNGVENPATPGREKSHRTSAFSPPLAGLFHSFAQKLTASSYYIRCTIVLVSFYQLYKHDMHMRIVHFKVFNLRYRWFIFYSLRWQKDMNKFYVTTEETITGVYQAAFVTLHKRMCTITTG